MPVRIAAGHDSSGPCTAQMPAAAMLRHTNAAHSTRKQAVITASARAPAKAESAPCQFLSFARFARCAFTWAHRAHSSKSHCNDRLTLLIATRHHVGPSSQKSIFFQCIYKSRGISMSHFKDVIAAPYCWEYLPIRCQYPAYKICLLDPLLQLPKQTLADVPSIP